MTAVTRGVAPRVAIACAAALVALVWAAGVAAAADPTFGVPDATSSYGESITFTQQATLPTAPKRVEILLDFPGGAGPVATEIDEPTGIGEVTLRHKLSLSEGHLLPNTTIVARWRVTAADGSTAIGPPVRVLYQDTRFTWKTKSGALVRVHWYEGSNAFGDRALAIGERAVKETSTLLGVTEKDPIDFFVYADKAAFYDALGPSTRENVGGQANAELRTLFALITPAEIDADWVGIVIPHELTHLVFNTAVDNPYHFPPRWLNEGLAVYLSQGYASDDRQAVEDAAADGTLMPLGSLSGQFPTTRDRFSLAYAEGASSVDFFVRAHGRDALIALIRSYADGLTDDEAFRKSIGVDVAGFDAAWRDELHARDPLVRGPQPAPPGPLPAGWLTAEGSAAPTLPPQRPGATTAPQPPGAATSDPAAPSGGAAIGAIFVGLGVVVVAGVAGYVLANRRRGHGVTWTPVDATPADPRPVEPPPAQEPPPPASS